MHSTLKTQILQIFPAIISTIWTNHVNYLYESYGSVKPEYTSWLSEKWTSNTKYHPLDILVPNLFIASRGISSYKNVTFQEFKLLYENFPFQEFKLL